MKNPYSIILQPLITEKTTRMKDDHNKLAFIVHQSANKVEIKKAIEALFNVTVLKIRTLNMTGKIKRFGVHQGKRSNWKKAYVTLSEKDHIDFFESV